MKHIILYSHGFGVRKDDRGQFPDIAASMPEFEHVMFEYNQIDETANTMTVRPIDQQAKTLAQMFYTTKKANPEAVIDIVCHSQGCSVAAAADLPARKTIFLAPPQEVSVKRIQQFFGNRPGATLNPAGVSRVPRKDGSITQIPAEYWHSLEGINMSKIYIKLSKNTDLHIIIAQADDVLGKTKLNVPHADIQVLPGDHNFSGKDRVGMVRVVQEILQN